MLLYKVLLPLLVSTVTKRRVSSSFGLLKGIGCYLSNCRPLLNL
jgi:hypothetical protein